MKKTELLNQLIHFNEEACNCQVVLDGANIISKFKSESKLDMQNINQTFEELGFRHIRVRKYTDDDCIWHTLGTEKMELKDLIYDISYRLEYYSSVRRIDSLFHDAASPALRTICRERRGACFRLRIRRSLGNFLSACLLCLRFRRR